MCISKAAITKIVDRLEERGYLARRPSEADRRVTHLVLTDPGRTLVNRSRPVLRGFVKERMADHLGLGMVLAQVHASFSSSLFER